MLEIVKGLSYKPIHVDEWNSIQLIAYSRLLDETCLTIDDMPLMAARISTARDSKTGENRANDDKLMKFLAEHKHLTPFEHQTVTFRVVAPLAVFREWHRHRTQSYNEMSMRYTSDPVGKFYVPLEWRFIGDKTNKQGSTNQVTNPLAQLYAYAYQRYGYEAALFAYKGIIENGIAKEQARFNVPVGNYSEMYATANLRNWHGFWKLRADKNAQWEIRKYADAIDNILSYIMPRSWEILKCYA